MNWGNIFKTYLLIYIRYYIARKIAATYKFVRVFSKSNWIGKFIFPIMISIQLFFLIIALLLFNYAFGYVYVRYSEELVFTAWTFLIFLVGVSSGFSLTRRVISPLDRELLLVTPLSVRSAFHLNWISGFILDFFWTYFYLMAFFVYLFFTYEMTVYFVVYALLNLGASIILAYIVSIAKCLVLVKRIEYGFKWLAFLFSFLIGLFILFISIIFFHGLFFWLSNEPNIFILGSYIKLISDTLSVFFNYMSFLYQFPNLISYLVSMLVFSNNEGLVGVIISFSTLSLIAFLCYQFAGCWYAISWTTPKNKYEDWIYYIEKRLASVLRNTFTKVQVHHWLRDRLIISQNYTYFFGHFFLYVYLAIAISLAQPEINLSPLVKLIILFLLFNSMSRDAFDTVSLFPSLFRFDGDGRVIELYRITNTNLYQLYKSKIAIQRVIGSFECIIMTTLLLLIIPLAWYEVIFVLSIVLMNAICVPHLMTLPSFATPHFNRQHFSEAEDYLENDIVQSQVNDRLVQFLLLISIIPIIFLVVIDLPFLQIYLTSSLFILITTCIVYGVTYIARYKLSVKYEHKDLL